LEIGRYGVQKIRNFTLISKRGFLSLYLAPVQKLEPKNTVFWEVPKKPSENPKNPKIDFP
jgi:hypothetical protein